ncbi:DNA mismatch repair endonuclease MutL, partial [Aeromonas veronii]|nr:DNA mismatch repair endonuclease MutL [Aeromonas veronii]
MDPLLVDVNVHPAKLEVRISKEQELNQLIDQGIKDVFKHKQLIPDAINPKKKEVQKSEQQQFVFQHSIKAEPREQQPFVPKFVETIQLDSRKEEPKIETQTQVIPSIYEERAQEREKLVIEESDFTTTVTLDENEETDFESTEIKINEAERVPVMYPIGQMHGTYILAQNENGLYIIDQHAAQERIKYEYFKERVGENISDLQELLLPITLEYSTDECININAHKQDLEQVGIFLEPFGHNSYIVRSHPQWFPKGDEKEVIEEIIEQVLNDKK